ncbi:MAG: hypothetical protein RI893_1066 [Pseudomonadota bacterium]
MNQTTKKLKTGTSSYRFIKFKVDIKPVKTDNVHIRKAPVAQLDRVLGYEPSGREFESLQAHHTEKNYSPVAQSVERMTVNH